MYKNKLMRRPPEFLRVAGHLLRLFGQIFIQVTVFHWMNCVLGILLQHVKNLMCKWITLRLTEEEMPIH